MRPSTIEDLDSSDLQGVSIETENRGNMKYKETDFEGGTSGHGYVGGCPVSGVRRKELVKRT